MPRLAREKTSAESFESNFKYLIKQLPFGRFKEEYDEIIN
ncbi:MAG: hypothetical protein K0R09_184 [Clostridiales bacterium]|jgi:hypothetical protein|nr:hypothetical protein [Clostridiales bacterium]